MSGRTTTSNFSVSKEVFERISDYGMRDCIALTGGDGFFFNVGGVNINPYGDKMVNSIGVILE